MVDQLWILKLLIETESHERIFRRINGRLGSCPIKTYLWRIGRSYYFWRTFGACFYRIQNMHLTYLACPRKSVYASKHSVV